MPNESPKDGPANAFQKALSEGDLDQAREELDKIVWDRLEQNPLVAEKQ